MDEIREVAGIGMGQGDEKVGSYARRSAFSALRKGSSRSLSASIMPVINIGKLEMTMVFDDQEQHGLSPGRPATP